MASPDAERVVTLMQKAEITAEEAKAFMAEYLVHIDRIEPGAALSVIVRMMRKRAERSAQ